MCQAMFAAGLPLAIHCNVFVKVTKEFTFDEPRHWVVPGQGRAGRISYDLPGSFLHPAPSKAPRSMRRLPLATWKQATVGREGTPSEPSVLMRDYLDLPREQLMEPSKDPWELAANLRAADRRLDWLACWNGPQNWSNAIRP